MTNDDSLTKARQAIERALTATDPRRGAGTRGKVHRLARDETIGGIPATIEAEAAEQGSARVITAVSAPIIEVVETPGWSLPPITVGQWSNLDRGRLVCNKVLAAVGWSNDQRLRATYPAVGVVRLKSSPQGTHGRIEHARGRIQLAVGLVRRANLADWPGVAVLTDQEQVFLVNVVAARFDMDRRPS
jgi:hypothetical protein